MKPQTPLERTAYTAALTWITFRVVADIASRLRDGIAPLIALAILWWIKS